MTPAPPGHGGAPRPAGPESPKATAPQPTSPDAVSELRELYAFMQSERLTEISLETPGVPGRVRLRRASSLLPSPREPAHAPVARPGTFTVTTPISGVFYRSPSPRAKVFIEIGAEVTPGQTLCLVEAMKMMNEIQATARGRVVKILVENGKPVKAGQDLFMLEPL